MHNMGGMLSRLSIVDPEIDHWAMEVNESYSNERKMVPHTGVAHGDTGVGKPKQIGKVDIMEVYFPSPSHGGSKEVRTQSGGNSGPCHRT